MEASGAPVRTRSADERPPSSSPTASTRIDFPAPVSPVSTLSLTREAQYTSMFSFKYSPRPNTLASKRMTDDVTEDEKTARIVELQALQREIQTGLHERQVGTIVDVLVDSVSRRESGTLSGRTSANSVVSFAPPAGREDAAGRDDESLTGWLGHTMAVRITRAGPHSLVGELATAGDGSC